MKKPIQFLIILFLFSLIVQPQVFAGAGDIVGNVNPPGNVPWTVIDTFKIINAVIKLLVAVAGIYSLWQFLSAGLDYITSDGDKGKIQTAMTKFTMAIVGLGLIAASFIIIAIVGFLFFGDASIFLQPSLESI